MRLVNLAAFVSLGVAFRLPVSNAAAPLPNVESNDNTSEAGILANGVLTVRLDAGLGDLRPEGDHNPSLAVFAFGEENKPLQAPAPLIRVRAGTPVHIVVRNFLPKALLLRGLSARPGMDSIDLAPGERKEVTFTPMTPGTYFYWGRTDGNRVGQGFWNDGQLAGAFIVDAGGPKRAERVMVITNWGDLSDPSRATTTQTHFMMNGRLWPYTERLTYQLNDSVFWRVINATTAPHPMHLHGFYFRVDSRGDASADTVFSTETRRLAVTELMLPGSTMAVAWSPNRPGNWVFHCHFIEHISPDARLGRIATMRADLAHGMHSHALDGMSGLVIGLTVLPSKMALSRKTIAAPPRKLDLFIDQQAYYFGGSPAYSFVLQRGGTVPAPDSINIPGTPIILTRGVPVEITVHNRTSEMASVHWHGIELQSYYDGVGDWSGAGSKTAPPIAPGKSFVVKFTPDRAGTFIYHSHSDEDKQLSSGLYGPLIVVDPGQKYDLYTNRIMLLGAGGPKEESVPMINGSTSPAPLEFRSGVTYKFRFINIAPTARKIVRIVSGTTVQSWRAFAKDGATLPPAQATIRPAYVALASGETYDFEFTPAAAGVFRMDVTTIRRNVPPVTAVVPIDVK